MGKFADNTWFETESCCNCGMAFAMEVDFQKRRRADHKLFYCPAGHAQHYTGASAEQKLQRELAQKQRDLDEARHRAARAENERANIQKAHRKMRARVVNGVCPCCNRSFENLRMHMQTQHADFGKESTMLALRTAFGMTQQAVAEEAFVTAPYVSNFERGKPVPAFARKRLEGWLHQHEAA